MIYLLPLPPLLVSVASVAELHVEVRREDESEKCDSRTADEIKNRAERGDRLGDEEEAQNAE